MKAWMTGILVAVALSAGAQVPGPFGSGIPGPNKSYQAAEQVPELQDVEPPAYPAEGDLREFYVSAAATNRYFIDAGTLAVGTDGIVRYVVVVKTAGGATNVSFEGINCAAGSWKHYASGRSDRAWTKSRAARIDWRPIENKPLNPYHAALSRYFFCPTGSAINTADEARDALRLGRHPRAD